MSEFGEKPPKQEYPPVGLIKSVLDDITLPYRKPRQVAPIRPARVKPSVVDKPIERIPDGNYVPTKNPK